MNSNKKATKKDTAFQMGILVLIVYIFAKLFLEISKKGFS